MFGTGIVKLKLLPIMKLFFSAVLFLLTESVFCQLASSEAGQSDGLPNSKWDLSKYVWSQTHATQKVNKPPLDYNAIDGWVYLDETKLSLSPDGNYCAYGTYKGDRFSHRDEILTIRSTAADWQRAFPLKSSGFFSADNKQYIFLDNDVLNFVQLGTDQIRSIRQVKSFKKATNDAAEWMAYQMNNSEGDLILQNLVTGKEKKIDHVNDYEFDRSAKWLTCQLKNEKKEILLCDVQSGKEMHILNVESHLLSDNGESIALKTVSNNKIEIKYLSLLGGEAQTIWSTTVSNLQVTNYSLDETGKQVVFSVKSSASVQGDERKENNSIWYYKAGMEKAVLKVDNWTKGIEDRLRIGEATSFTEDGNYIQFELKKEQLSFTPPSDAIMVDVWNYKDNFLQSTKSITSNGTSIYKALINLDSDKIVQLDNDNEKLILLKRDFAVIQKSDGLISSDRFWEFRNEQDSAWLISLKKGTRQLLPISKGSIATVWFSAESKYLLYLDLDNGCHYFSLDLTTGKKIKITNGIPDWILGHENKFHLPHEKATIGCGIAGWLKGDSMVLVYDDYDIWQLDLTGKMAPTRITNGYGRKHKIFLSLLNNDRGSISADYIFQPNDTLLLSGFNTTNKYFSFYRTKIGFEKEPELLSAGPYFYFDLYWAVDMGYSYGRKPIHALNANTWIVERQSATEAPNYFVTGDFRIFRPLTQFQSPKDYNSLTSELHSFKQWDGTTTQGILYKPENFDPSKKYPVIISFYTQSSGALYQFPEPKYIECAELIGTQCWMVSQGYLVFFPDIYFTKGQWGPSVVNSVVGAANYVSQLPYVDSKRIGACGHSNGGRMGYYLFTHSNCFAAMSISSGTTDIISNGLKMDKDGKSSMSWAEEGFPNGGIGELWKNKATWLDHASVLHADEVTCPLLILQNKQDGSYMQAFEMFTSLRRLKKYAWWLQYDKGNHRINSLDENLNELKDYTIRYTQFWDHFLKGAPAPGWMTNGIPYFLKGLESRLYLDPSGNCGLSDKPCIICAVWNKQYKRNPEMFAKAVSEWKLDNDLHEEMENGERVRYIQNMKKDVQRKQENNRKLHGGKK